MANNLVSFDFNLLVASIRQVDERLSAKAGRAVNICLTLRNWLIGAYIAEYELRGADRATYGDRLLFELAKRLKSIKLSNCNRRQLYRYLRFYRLYPSIVGTLSPQCRPAHRSAVSQRDFRFLRVQRHRLLVVKI